MLTNSYEKNYGYLLPSTNLASEDIVFIVNISQGIQRIMMRDLGLEDKRDKKFYYSNIPPNRAIVSEYTPLPPYPNDGHESPSERISTALCSSQLL